MNHADLNPDWAEDVVIGQVLYEPECIARAARMLKPEHFYGWQHKVVFETALKLWRDGTPVDLVTMYHALRKRRSDSGVTDMDRIGGPAWLSEKTNRVAQTTHLEAHAEIVREQYALRTLRNTGLRMAQESIESADPSEILGSLTADVAKATMADVATDVNAGERAYAMLNTPERPPTWYMGMAGLDEFVFLREGNMISVSAESGVGKTAFVLQAAINLAPKLKPWIVSLEMPADELITRCICNLAQVDIDLAMAGQLSDADKERLARAANDHHDLLKLLDIDDSGEMTIDQFSARAEHKVRSEGCKLIVLDYAQLVQADTRTYPTQVLQLEAISKGIQRTLRKLKVPGLIVVHINRDGKAHGSTQFEKDAHVRLKLTREPHSKTMGIEILKNRNGRTVSASTPCEMRWGIIGHMPDKPLEPKAFIQPPIDFTQPVEKAPF